MAKTPPYQKMALIAFLGMAVTELGKQAEAHKDDPQVHDVLENLAVAISGAMTTLSQYT